MGNMALPRRHMALPRRVKYNRFYGQACSYESRIRRTRLGGQGEIDLREECRERQQQLRGI